VPTCVINVFVDYSVNSGSDFGAEKKDVTNDVVHRFLWSLFQYVGKKRKMI